jgi:RHS repeat-associated protein
MTVTGQTAVSYAYDSANRLTQITQGTPTVSFVYDNANRRSTLTLPNGIVTSYGYDDASELTGIIYTTGSTTLGDLTYSYDQAGRRASMGGSYATTGLPLPVSNATYNANNQLTQWGTANLYYDANGNMTSDGTNSYTWNARNQLASMNFNNVSFQYDGYGRRTGKTISSSTANYLYDGANPVQELSGASVTANLLTGLGVDEYFTRTDSNGTANFLSDALGNTIALTDNSGNTLASYGYQPFGNTTVTSGSSANPYQYTGRENDGTGLYFNRARYYSPTLQRFISEDPIGFDADFNVYTYTGDNPIDVADPSGLGPDCRLFGPCSSRGRPHRHRPSKTAGRYTPPPCPAYHGDCPIQPELDPITAAAAGAAAASIAGGFAAGAAGADAVAGILTDAATDDVVNVTFGHGFLHLVETGLDQSAVESAIEQQVQQIVTNSSATGNFWGQVIVDGQEIFYRASTLRNGTINVGTYTVGAP